MALSEIKHEWTDELVCPHCGHVHSDSWEMNSGDEGDWDMECHECDETFDAQRHVTVKYSTSKPA